MRLEETKIKLDSMLNQTYRFSQDNLMHTLLHYEVVGNVILLKTDRKSFTNPIEATATFLSGFKKDEIAISRLPEEVPEWKMKMNSSIERLGATLFDNLEKLKTDPDFVDQAREINNHVNTIINVAKLQIQLNK